MAFVFGFRPIHQALVETFQILAADIQRLAILGEHKINILRR